MPTDDDLPALLAVAKAGIHPPDEMPFGVAWTSLRGAGVRSRVHAAPLGDARDVRARRLDAQPDGRVGGRADRRPVASGPAGSPSSARWTPARGWVRRSRAAASARRCAPRSSGSPSTAWAPRVRRDLGLPRQRRRRTACRAALGYEENGLRQPGARGRRAGHPELPDDGRGLAVAAAAAARRSRGWTGAATVRGLAATAPSRPGRRARTRRRPRRRHRPTSRRRTRRRRRRPTTTASCRSSRARTSSRRRPGCPSPRTGRRRCHRRPSS